MELFTSLDVLKIVFQLQKDFKGREIDKLNAFEIMLGITNYVDIHMIDQSNFNVGHTDTIRDIQP